MAPLHSRRKQRKQHAQQAQQAQQQFTWRWRPWAALLALQPHNSNHHQLHIILAHCMEALLGTVDRWILHDAGKQELYPAMDQTHMWRSWTPCKFMTRSLPFRVGGWLGVCRAARPASGPATTIRQVAGWYDQSKRVRNSILYSNRTSQIIATKQNKLLCGT